ncbi:MAG: hypothetical protein JXR97_00165 [Planctomycetes bacterium]|nr:hypothetical protein [Planctomycetota bacterium]
MNPSSPNRLWLASLAACLILTGVALCGDGQSLDSIFKSPAFANGNLDAYYLQLLSEAVSDKSHCADLLRLANLIERDKLSSPSLGRQVLETITQDASLPADAIDAGRNLLGRILTDAGEYDKAKEINAARGIVPAWNIIGPFGKYGRASFYTRFEPENRIDLDAEYDGTTGKIKWKSLPASACMPEVVPHKLIIPHENVVYLFTQFKAEAETPYILHVDTPCSFTLWVNGEQMACADRIRNELPQQTTIPPIASNATTIFTKGWNRILVKLYSDNPSDTFQLKLGSRGGARQPLKNLTWETRKNLNWQNPAALREGNTPIRIETPNMDKLSASELALFASLVREHGMVDEAYRAANKLVSLEPNNPRYLCILAETELSASHLPVSKRKNNLEKAYRKALEINPNYIPALAGLARYELGRDHYNEAIRLCDRALSVNPSAAEALSLKTGIALKNKWTGEANEWIADMMAKLPNATASLENSAFLAMTKNEMDKCEKFSTKAWHSNRSSQPLFFSWLRTLLKLERYGDITKAVEEVDNSWLDNADFLNELAGIYESMGDKAQAIKTVRKSLVLMPDDYETCRKLGDLLYGDGKQDEALESYKKSLSLSPEQFELRKLIDTLEGNDYRFWTKYDRDPIDALKKTNGLFLQGNTARVIDQTVLQINEDGSFSNLTHGLQKVLARSGMSDASSVPVNGDMIEVRTILPNGKTLEPLRIPGKRDFTMPGIDVGAAVEEEYIQHFNAPFDRSLRFAKWYFMSPSIEESFLLSEYVIRVHKSYPFTYVERNLDHRVRFEKSEDGDYYVYKWIAERMPRGIHENGSPDIDELLPFVEIGGKRSWQDVNSLLMNAYLGRTLVTHEIRNTTASLINGAKTEKENVSRLHNFVCTEIDNQESKSPASEVLSQRSGERAILLMAMLDAAGMKPVYAAVRPSKDMLVEPNWDIPQALYFPLRLIFVELKDGTQLWLDTRYRTLGCGESEMLEDVAGATALMIGEGRGDFRTIPPLPATAFAESESRIITLPAKGELVTISGEHIIRGTAAHILKENLAGTSARIKRNSLEDHLSASVPGVTTLELANPGLEEASPFREVYKATSESLLGKLKGGIRTVPLCLTPLKLLPESDENQRERQTPFHLKQHRVSNDTITMSLPKGAAIAKLPDSINIMNAFGFYSMKVSTDGKDVIISRRYQFNPQRVGLDKWKDFVDMTDKIESAEKQRLHWTSATNTDKD